MLLSHCSTNCCCPLNSSKTNCCCPMNSSKKMVSGSPWLLDLLQKWINWTLMKEGMDSRQLDRVPIWLEKVPAARAGLGNQTSAQSIEAWLRAMTDWILWLRPINIVLSLFQCNQWGSNTWGDCCWCGLRAADSDLARISSLEKVTWIHQGHFFSYPWYFCSMINV